MASEKEFLPQIEYKLFFILAYQKNASLQEFFAAAFDTEQAFCNKYIHILAPILEKSLSQYAPTRNIEEVNFQEGQKYLGDATERAIQRDTYDQESFYSGKKKRHTVKNMAFCSILEALLFLSPTVSGRTHDKTIAETLHITEKKITFYLDLAYLNWKPNKEIEIILPHKKPRNTKTEKRKLTIQQKRI
ncbi:MAG: transposase family protein [Emticicia sp.]|nr:transposase family protein [Emticicia sp.]